MVWIKQTKFQLGQIQHSRVLIQKYIWFVHKAICKSIVIKDEKQNKYLGLNFTSSMTWNCHLEIAIKKGFHKLNHLRRVIPRTTKENVKCNLVKTYILCGLLCIKCLEPRTPVSSTLRQTAKIMFKMNNLPFSLGWQRTRWEPNF